MSYTNLAIISAVLGFAPAAGADPQDVRPPTTDEDAQQDLLARLLATGRNLASNGSCEAVKNVAAQVRQLDSHYYETVFLADSVIAACGAPQAPSEKPPVEERSATDADRSKPGSLTFDVEVGGGFAGYHHDNCDNCALGAFIPSSTSFLNVGVFNVGAGVGVFVTPRIAIGVRALAAFSPATDVTYAPFDAAVHFRVSASHEAGLLELTWHRGHLWSGAGLGVGRVDLALDDSASHAAYGLAGNMKIGVRSDAGITASVEATLIATSSTASGPTAQEDFAFLVGWQHL